MTKVSDTQCIKNSQYIDDIKRRLNEGSLSLYDVKTVIGPLIGQFHKTFPQETSHLRLIGETTISETIAGKGMKKENKRLFRWFDNGFDKQHAQTVFKNTEEVKALVYEQVKNGTYADILGSFNKGLDVLSFETHEQIIDFIENSFELLHPNGQATHFLYKGKRGKLFVATVILYSAHDMHVNVKMFLNDLIWSAKFACRFVILSK